MAKRKKKKGRKGKVPPQLRAYLFKKGHGKPRRKRGKRRSTSVTVRDTITIKEGTRHMAKKKRRKSKSRHRGGARRSHSGGGGIFGGIMRDAPLIAAGAAVGFAEKSIAAKDGVGNALASLPSPIDALGKVGNLSLLAYVGSYLFKGTIGHYLGIGAKAGAIITARDIIKRGKAFDKADELAGVGDYDGAAEHMLGEDEIGALAEEVAGRLHGRVGPVDVDLAIDDGLPHQADAQPELHPDAVPPA